VSGRVINYTSYNNAGQMATSANNFSLPPDNQAHQLFLNGGYNFTKDTRATFKLEYGRATQDDSFALPYSGSPAGITNLDGEVVTKLAQIGLTSRVTKDFSLNANLRYYDKDDQTPTNIRYTGNATVADAHYHWDQSIRTWSGKVEAAYRFADVYTLVGSIEEKRQKRALPTVIGTTPSLNNDGSTRLVRVPFRHKLDETTSRLELRRNLTDTLNGSISWIHAKRDGSRNTQQPFSTNDGEYMNQNPINTADRKRDKARLSLDWTPLETVSLQLVVEDGKDKYSGQNAYGMEEGKTRLYSLDASWTATEKLSFNAWYSYDESKAKQTGRLYSNNANNKRTFRYDLEDSADSFGVGVKWEAASTLHTGGNLEWTRSVGAYDIGAWTDPAGVTANPQAGATYGVPDITNKHLRVSLFGLYALDKKSDLRLDVVHDRWKTDDWTWKYADGRSMTLLGDANNSSTVTTVLTKPNQSATFVGLRYIYKFQ
jgi:MtrB/PioB family decaheme-associated outer membrane protein